ncbi:ABC transporter ATP-binding protein [Jeongeupia naejangsanensis]|uniref:ABC transporter ATP-binding protein n=1 Tax=Jeongeupia naejangsanensis TaxID=613195 RepID=A0ABS2BQH6_9NEIS|nr:ABC transporter ATP-binding protein [Jeongeupia naejangsanensis]MBM3117019.1 ABC transporter ATP-binding protein [Jeongeupia naejangsanensis]
MSTLSLNHVGKQYSVKGEQLDVLDDINLHIQPGEFVAIVGSSGCGKSTLLRLVIGLDDDYRGEIRIDGQKISGTSLDRGIVFQEHRLFPWLTVEQNVGLALENSPLSQAERRQTIADHLDLVGLKGFETAYPYQLSGGMSQRVAIARGLVNRPGVLLLDEPFGALDALTRANLQAELRRIWQQEGITMILVTHDVEEAAFLADRVIVLQPRPGRIKRIVPVTLPHPRNRADPAFVAIKDDVLSEFGHEPKPQLLEPVARPFGDYVFAW